VAIALTSGAGSQTRRGRPLVIKPTSACSREIGSVVDEAEELKTPVHITRHQTKLTEKLARLATKNADQRPHAVGVWDQLGARGLCGGTDGQRST